MKKILITSLCVSFIVVGLSAQKTISVQQTSIVGKSQSTVSATSETNVATISEPALPGFPVYQDTGNKELDVSNYSAAKQEWIKINQEVYDKYLATLSGTSSINQASTPVNIATTKRVLSASDFNALPESRKTYALDHPELFTIEK